MIRALQTLKGPFDFDENAVVLILKRPSMSSKSMNCHKLIIRALLDPEGPFGYSCKCSSFNVEETHDELRNEKI